VNLGKKTKKELLEIIRQLTQSNLPAAPNTPEENLYRILAQSSQVGFYIMQDKKFRFVNSHLRDYAGYEEDEILRMDPSSLILPEDRRKTRKNAVMMLKEQRFSPYEFRIVTKDGRIKWIMETVMSITYQGRPAILGNLMDITERKEASHRLEELEALESSILDAIPQAVVGLHERRINFAKNSSAEASLYFTAMKKKRMKSAGGFIPLLCSNAHMKRNFPVAGKTEAKFSAG